MMRALFAPSCCEPSAAKVAKDITAPLALLPTATLAAYVAPSCHVPPFLRKPTPRLYNAGRGARPSRTELGSHGEVTTVQRRAVRGCSNGVVEERRPPGLGFGCCGGVRRGGGGGEQVRRRGAAQLGQRPRAVRGRPPQAPPRQLLRRGIRVQEQVPVWQGHRRSEARAWGLCRRRHRFLFVVGGGQAQRVRLRVPGQRHRRALPGADQPLHRRRGQPGAAHRPLVRPHHRLPHLLRALEPQPGRLPRRRHPHPRLREQDRHQGPPPPPQRHQQHHHLDHHLRVPVAAAHGGLQLHLERGRLGHPRRAGQDGLVARALRGHLPGRERRGLRLGGERHRLRRRRGGALHGHLVGQGGQVLVEGEGHAGAHRAPESPARLGARTPPRLRLLRRHRPLPRPAAGVLRPLIRSVDAS